MRVVKFEIIEHRPIVYVFGSSNTLNSFRTNSQTVNDYRI